MSKSFDLLFYLTAEISAKLVVTHKLCYNTYINKKGGKTVLYLAEVLFYLIPIGSIAFFIVSLVAFCTSKSANKHSPGSYTDSQMRTRKTLLIISSVIMGVLAAVVIGLMVLLFIGIAYM